MEKVLKQYIAVLVLFFLLANATSLIAQDDACRASYQSALNLFNQGRFDNVPPTLTTCVTVLTNQANANQAIDQGFAINVVKLIVKSYRAIDNESQAQAYIGKLAGILRTDYATANKRMMDSGY